jgi:hypothetical protein
VEHVERQEERERDIAADADELEGTADEMEQHGEQLEEQIGELREDWENKQRSEEVPGAQEPGHGGASMSESHGGSDVDPRPGTSENPGAAEGDTDQATGNPPNDDSPAADDD